MISRTPGAIASRRPLAVALVGFLVAMVDGYDTLMLAFVAPLISGAAQFLTTNSGVPIHDII
jgi:hypothetical protein